MHEHLSRELFRAIHKGWRNPGDLAAIAMAHLFELCPHCRSEFEAWRGELGEGVARDEGDYDGALQKVRERTAANDLGPDAEEARVERGRREARSRAEELLALPDDQRLDWIRNEQGCHSGLLVAEALIEECRRTTPGYPRQGLLLANLSRVVLHHAPANDFALDLFVRSLAHLGNVVRVLGDNLRADQLLDDARYLLRVHPVGDRNTRAEIDSLVGSLKMEQYREDEAIAVLLRALMAYELERDDLGTAVVLVQLARAHLQKREPLRALTLVNRAEGLLEPLESPYLMRIVRQLRASALSALDRIEEARAQVRQSFAMGYEDPLMTLRCRWLTSRIDARAGEFEVAVENMLDVRNQFVAKRLPADVANAELTLAKIYCRQGRYREALDLVGSAETAFVDLGITRALDRVHRVRRAAKVH